MRLGRRVFVAVVVVALAGQARAAFAADPGRTVVVWVSVDGMRGDYADRYETPFLRRLMREGAYTKQLVPVFPSLTFPSHVSEVTGVPVGRHGIPGNAFYDSGLKQAFSFPNDGGLLQAEPIWITASRQGVRTAVAAWPMSYGQKGAVRAAYFSEEYPKDWDDARRLAEVVRLWEQDQHERPLQLLMGYIPGADTAGHLFGPESPGTGQAVRETDARLEAFFNQVNDVFRRKMTPRDRLYVLITTDHGMAEVHTLVNLEKLAADVLPEGARVVQATVAHVFLDAIKDGQERAGAAERLKRDLSRHPFLTVYLRDELPPAWGLHHRTRVGDVFVVPRVGYGVSDRTQEAMVETAKRPTLPRGAHGYPPEDCPEMLGLAVVWRSGEPLGGKDLGKVDSLRWHATVAKLLGIEPAEHAAPEPIRLP
jgi:hypothetical protein